MNKDYVIGMDYGTDSVRSVIIDASNGEEVSCAVSYYKRWQEMLFCDPDKNQFRQHPLDYIEGITSTIQESVKMIGTKAAENIRGISIDTTGSTPVVVNKEGVPLSLTREFASDPDAMFILWKDHTAIQEASDINEAAKAQPGIDYTKYCGGVYSSEWFWAKLLHVFRHNKAVYNSCYSVVEHCDWISALLTGNCDPLSLKRSRCAAGHKAMWHQSFNGLPPEEFLVKVDPLLKGIRGRLFSKTFTSDEKMGTISRHWAKTLGLPADTVIGVGAFDAHMGAVGGQIKPFWLTKIMGTSTCDMIVAPDEYINDRTIKGICGQVDGSIIPGMLGMEAGQSAFGDVYAWFASLLSWPLTLLQKSGLLKEDKNGLSSDNISAAIIDQLSKDAATIPVTPENIISVDWFNGRRTPDADQTLKGAVMELNLASTPPKIFRALVESTAFGAKKIVDTFISQGIPIEGVIGLGGVAKKSPFIMQTVSDVLNLPIHVVRSQQACALGAAMFAATASGVYKRIEDAQEKMGNGFETVYHPDQGNADIYKNLYKKYNRFGSFIEENTRK